MQQLAIHTEGGVVTEAQPLMVIAPSDYQAEVEATLENKDVGFVKVGQKAEVKVETFPFTRYGTIPGTVTFVSNDAVQDPKRGPTFQVRVKLDRGSLAVDQREVHEKRTGSGLSEQANRVLQYGIIEYLQDVPSFNEVSAALCGNLGRSEFMCSRQALDESHPDGLNMPFPRVNGDVSRLLRRTKSQAASACSFTPSARATLSTVAKLGFPSALSAL